MKNINKRIIILLILIIILVVLISYFDFSIYKSQNKNIEKSSVKINYLKNNDIPKYWINDLNLDMNMKTLSTIERIYSDELIITERQIESPYSINENLTFFKDYFNLNNWVITKEDSNYIAARREGYLSVNLENYNNKTLITLKYEYNPLNPLKPEPKQVFGDLPPLFPNYLIFKNSKINGYNGTLNDYTVLFSSEEKLKSIYDFYIKNLKENKWEIIIDQINDFSCEILALNKEINKQIKIQVIPHDENRRSISINISK